MVDIAAATAAAIGMTVVASSRGENSHSRTVNSVLVLVLVLHNLRGRQKRRYTCRMSKFTSLVMTLVLKFTFPIVPRPGYWFVFVVDGRNVGMNF